MQLFILGLRRSGTTAFWEVFRRDARFLGYNEPFNPVIRHLDERGGVSRFPAYREFHELCARDPARFWSTYEPIQDLDELEDGLSDRQADYLRFLLESGEHTVFDLTRGHLKLASLAKLAPQAVLVHLYRPAGSFATSHMVPSGSQVPSGASLRNTAWRLRNAVVKRRNRATFWSRHGRFHYWRIESTIGNSPDSRFAQRLREIGLDPEAVYAMPAVARLLAYWRVNFERIEADGPRHFGERFLSLSFDGFCRDPMRALERVYGALGSPVPELDVSGIHAPRGRYQPERADWQRHARALGIPESLL